MIAMDKKDNRQYSSKENAKHSTGPRTEEGKARSSQNATNHGAYSRKILLPGEDESEFNRLIQNHFDRFQPQDEIETRIVRQMAHTLWRSFRIAAAEAALLQIQMHRMTPAINLEFTTVTSEDLMALASASLHATGQGPQHLSRLEGRLQRQYDRLLRQLLEMREHFPAAPPAQQPDTAPETGPQPASDPQNPQSEQTNLTPAFNPASAIFDCLPRVSVPHPPARDSHQEEKAKQAAA